MMPVEDGIVIIPVEEEAPPQTLTFKALQHLYATGVTAFDVLAPILRRLLPEDGVVLPHPTLNYIITYLLGFVAIKAQGHPGFPYMTHHNSVLAAVISVVMFGITSAAEHIATCLHQPPVVKVIARTGRILFLFLFVIILTYLACF